MLITTFVIFRRLERVALVGAGEGISIKHRELETRRGTHGTLVLSGTGLIV